MKDSLKKLIFTEKLKGQNYLSLSMSINDKTLQFIIDHFKKMGRWSFFIFHI